MLFRSSYIVFVLQADQDSEALPEFGIPDGGQRSHCVISGIVKRTHVAAMYASWHGFPYWMSDWYTYLLMVEGESGVFRSNFLNPDPKINKQCKQEALRKHVSDARSRD